MRSSILILAAVLAVLWLPSGRLESATFTVTNTLDGGAGSLRDAMMQANANNAPDTIAFNIPGAGVQRIQPLSQLPILADSLGVSIDGLSQPGATAGADPPRTAVLMIEINGKFAGSSHGIHIWSAKNELRGLVINQFDRNGVYIQGVAPGPGTYDNIVYCCYIGMDAGGLTGVGNGLDYSQLWAGVYIDDAVGCRVENSLVSYNYADGVYCGGWIGCVNRITGNYIGTDKNGQSAYPNTNCGIVLDSGVYLTYVFGNLVSGNGQDGICLVGDPTGYPGPYTTRSTEIRENKIGLARDGTPLPNQMNGVSLGFYGTSYNGGCAAENWIVDNTIAFNLHDGIRVYEHTVSPWNADRNKIDANSIYANGGIGIDLDDDWVTANDPNDPDTGANTDLNFPVIDSARVCLANTTIWGTLDIDSAPDSAEVQVFKARPDPTGFGEGETYLASTTPDTAGNWSLTVTSLALGDTVTATTIDRWGNTSEFCSCAVVTQASAGMEVGESRHAAFHLHVVGPNPGRSGSMVRYSIPGSRHVGLHVYTVEGELVKTLVDRVEERGVRTASWDGRDQRGRRVASGVYIVRLEAGSAARAVKLVMLR